MQRLALLLMIASVVALGCQRTTERRTGEQTGRTGAKERAPEQHTVANERASEQHTGAQEKSSTAPKSMPSSSTSEGKAKTDTGTGPGLNNQQGQSGKTSEPASKPAGSSSTNP